MARARNPAVSVSKKRSAGPPILNVVYGASGSSNRTRLVSKSAARVFSFPESSGDMTSVKKSTSWSTAPRGRLLLAGILAAILAAPASGQRAELEKRILRTILPNGLEVIVVPNPGVPLVTIQAVVRNGSFTESPEYAGLSHLYEHMFFKANADYPRPAEFVNRASELGAVFNAQTREAVG